MIKNTIMHGDWLRMANGLPDNVADCSVTDPPWGIRFMAKKWDYTIPSVEEWLEAYRVLKPGAHMLVCCGTRTQHRMVCNIEDAGFEIRDVICWHYSQGFPKSMDISKAMDKASGSERVIIGVDHKAAARNPRPIKISGQDRNFGEDKRSGEDFLITTPATEAAKQWNGWGTALKPATEFWTLVRKPLSEPTVAANVLRWGVGGLNIDACRIPFRDPKDKESATWGTGINIIGGNYAGGNGKSDGTRKNIEANDSGRFPANLILDDFMAEEVDRQSGVLKSGSKKPHHNNGNDAGNKKGSVFGVYKSNDYDIEASKGGASRFFYVAKPSPEERGDSTHPTIKPQTLIQYLIKLICPIEPGRIVLEPFAGSGAHCIAARKLGLDFYASEIGEKECKEANERLIKEMGLFI